MQEHNAINDAIVQRQGKVAKSYAQKLVTA